MKAISNSSLLFLFLLTLISFAAANDAEFRKQIEADWLAEEARLDRNPADWAVIDSLFERTEKTVASWHAEPEGLQPLLAELAGLKREAWALRQAESGSADHELSRISRLPQTLYTRRAFPSALRSGTQPT